ncbi:CLUMA_CG012989, isoform A [Clunio marinus]|uniref:CLUMA_CG012989, isoform A n=1 Tax=Clunio marinus TaxID=568069 RepID=A0A1J1IMJ5_9DIPT|nr:CLUMA_CG012989, isoform A [Clunio marinus]
MFKDTSTKVLNSVKTKHAIDNFAVRKKTQKDLLKEWISERITHFCNVTSLHGYIHTINDEYRPFERWLWIILSILALIIAVVLLWISWNWTSETPTTTVIESTNYPTYNLPFPAVTICSMNKISKLAALEIASKMRKPYNITDEELAYKLRLLLHFRGSGNASLEEYREVSDIMEMNNENINYLLERLSPKCSDILERCSWKGSLQRCDGLFQAVNSSEGTCCSFNNYAFPKSNYDPKMLSSIPQRARRVTACGYQTGLTILLKSFKTDYFGTEIAADGFRIMIHNAYDYADPNSVVKLVAAKTEAFLSVKPESTYSTEDVYDLPPDIRNCFQYNERGMDTFRQYSYVNCMAECRSAMINDLCGCVPFNFPSNGSYTKCKMTDLQCVRKNKDRYAGSTFQFKNDSSEASRLMRDKCHCLPDCTFFTYPSEISTGTLNRDFSYNSLSFFKDTNLTDESLVHVFFNDLIATHYRKNMYQNWLSVLANFGGILGLFLGFSLVTGFELIYFFTIRTLFDKLAVKIEMRNKKKKQSEDEHKIMK